MNERQDIAELATGPTAIPLPAWIDVEGRTLVVVKRTEALIGSAGGPQGDIAAHDIDNVVGFFDLLDNGTVVRQGTPVCREPKGGRKRVKTRLRVGRFPAFRRLNRQN